MNNKNIIDNVLKSVFYMMDNESDLTDDDYLEIIDYLKGDLENDKKSIIEKRIANDRDYKILVNTINYEINRKIPSHPLYQILISIRRTIQTIIDGIAGVFKTNQLPILKWKTAIPAIAVVTTVLLVIFIPRGIEFYEIGHGEFHPIGVGGERGSREDISFSLQHSLEYNEDDKALLFKWTQSNPNVDKYIIKINQQEFVALTNNINEKVSLAKDDTLIIRVTEQISDKPIFQHDYKYLIKR